VAAAGGSITTTIVSVMVVVVVVVVEVVVVVVVMEEEGMLHLREHPRSAARRVSLVHSSLNTATQSPLEPETTSHVTRHTSHFTRHTSRLTYSAYDVTECQCDAGAGEGRRRLGVQQPHGNRQRNNLREL
jgi:hypothetical protein